MLNFRFHHLKLRNKLIVIYVICVFLPIVLTNVTFYHVTTLNVKKQKTADAEQAMTLLQSELGALIDDAAGISYLYSIDNQLGEHLNTEHASSDRYVESLSGISNLFNRADKEYKTISSVTIMSDNPTILTSSHIIKLEDETRDTDWYRQIVNYNNTFPHLYVTHDSISVIQKLPNRRYGTYENVVKIDLNKNYVQQIFDLSGFEGDIYLLDPSNEARYGRLASGQPSGLITEDRSPRLDEIPKPNKAIVIAKQYQSSRYLNDWKVYGVLDEANILYEVRQSGRFILWFAAINFFVPTIVILIFSRSIHTRIQELLKHMKSVRGNNFERVPYHQERDEVGQLAVEFNRMSARIENLINDFYVSELQKKELELRQRQAQLHALHSQINPHFLFNALETVRMRSLMNGESQTAKTIQNMATIFRKSIIWKRSFVTIREELELIECFLEIQKYRFDSKLEYHIEVDQSVMAIEIPKMAFLPFVENASIHGIENIPGIGYITIQIAQEQEQIIFLISDNGSGIAQEKIDELHRYIHEDDAMGDSIGMKNVMTRLKIYYGESFNFAIASAPNKGTRITLRLPITRSE
ncbi:two-component system sensor histidine kinase YesM [Paenibacillus phyllosphaerae]|uniref:histidine kinase n=1 Tax=Paenibacillus phyllosphaerae TaxID=274593 RepID=A0A7W5ATM3_9BACL|nr:sensor histidine kinase [Paenibacillus phyllosphaerae]MBB3108061.1 two-component system sensor histidine kinase YesM [Paenibacillus phyllosphaerae]